MALFEGLDGGCEDDAVKLTMVAGKVKSCTKSDY